MEDTYENSGNELLDLIEAAEREESERLNLRPDLERIPRLIRSLLFDATYASSETPDSDLRELAFRWKCEPPDPPPQWRLRIWERLIGSELFRELSLSSLRLKSPYKQGLPQGTLICLLRIYRHTLSRYPLSNESTDLAAVTDLLLNLSQLENILVRSERNFAIDYLHRIQKGLARFATDSGQALAGNEAETIYFSLIENSSIIQSMDTVDDIYRLLASTLGNRFPHSPETFKRICNRIKLRGARFCRKQS